MAKNFDLIFNIGAKIAGAFSRTTGGAVKQLSALAESAQKTQSKLSQIKVFKDYQDRLSRMESGLVKARGEFDKLGDEIKQTANPTEEMVAKFEKARATSERLEKQIAKTRAQLEKVPNSAKLSSMSAEGLAKEQAKLERHAKWKGKLAAIGGGVNAATGAGTRISGMVSGGTMLAAAAAAGPMGAAISWEKQLAEFNKVADLSKSELADVSKYAMDLAAKTGVAREEIIGAMTAASQAGYAREEWEKFAELSYKMAIGFDMSADESGNMLRSWRSGLGLTQEEAEKLANTVNHLSNTMNASAKDVGEVIQRQGATIKSAGLDTGTIAALSASMLESGLAPEVVATAAKNFTSAFAKGTSHTNSKKKALAALGFDDPDALAKDMQENGQEAMIKLLKAFEGVPEHQKFAAAVEIFGEEGIGVITPLLGNVNKLSAAFKKLDEDSLNGSLQKEVDSLGNTTAQNMKKAKEALKQTATELGSQFLPALNSVLSGLTTFTKWVGGFIERNPMLIKALGGIAAAIGVIKVAMIAVNTVMKMNPILRIVSLILAGVTLIIENWESIRDTFMDIWEGLSDFFSGIWDGMVGIAKKSVEFIVGLAQKAIDAFEVAWAYVSGDERKIAIHTMVTKLGYTKEQAEADYDADMARRGRMLTEAFDMIKTGNIAPVFHTTVNYSGDASASDVQQSVERAMTPQVQNFLKNPMRLAFGN